MRQTFPTTREMEDKMHYIYVNKSLASSLSMWKYDTTQEHMNYYHVSCKNKISTLIGR